MEWRGGERSGKRDVEGDLVNEKRASAQFSSLLSSPFPLFKFLAQKESLLLNFTELASIESLLSTHSTQPLPPGTPSTYVPTSTRLSYESFCRIRTLVTPRARRYFSAGMFLSFQPDNEGRIEGGEFFRRLCSTICITAYSAI